MSSLPSPASVRYQRGVYLPNARPLARPVGRPALRVRFPRARRPHRPAPGSHSFHRDLPAHARASAGPETSRTPPRFPPDRRRHPARPADHAVSRRAHRRFGAVIHRKRRRQRQRALHGRFQVARRAVRRGNGWTQADTLIMETTFGLPRFRFPPTPEVLAQVVKFCREAIEEDVVPVLFGYSLGKSQEILCALDRAGLPAMLHGAVHRMTEVYRELQPDFPHFERYDADKLAGKVLHLPAEREPFADAPKDQGPAHRDAHGLGADAGGGSPLPDRRLFFPLSDHADYDDLLRYVELVKPRRVLTLHGYAAAFAADLRARGVESWALSEENQMEMTFASVNLGEVAPALDPTPTPSSEPTPADEAEPSEFAAFARVGDAIAATTGKLRKIEILSEYFRTLDDDALPIAALYLAGRAFAQSDPRVLNIGGAVIRRALLAVSGVGEDHLRRLGTSLADLSEVADAVLPGKHAAPAVFAGGIHGFVQRPGKNARPAGQGRTFAGNARPAVGTRSALRHQNPHGRSAHRLEGRTARRIPRRRVRPARRRHPRGQHAAGRPGPRGAAGPRRASAQRRVDAFPAHQVHARQPRADRRGHLAAARGTPRRQPQIHRGCRNRGHAVRRSRPRAQGCRRCGNRRVGGGQVRRRAHPTAPLRGRGWQWARGDLFARPAAGDGPVRGDRQGGRRRPEGTR